MRRGISSASRSGNLSDATWSSPTPHARGGVLRSARGGADRFTAAGRQIAKCHIRMDGWVVAHSHAGPYRILSHANGQGD